MWKEYNEKSQKKDKQSCQLFSYIYIFAEYGSKPSTNPNSALLSLLLLKLREEGGIIQV